MKPSHSPQPGGHKPATASHKAASHHDSAPRHGTETVRLTTPRPKSDAAKTVKLVFPRKRTH